MRIVETGLLAVKVQGVKSFGYAAIKYGLEVNSKNDGGKWELLRLAVWLRGL